MPELPEVETVRRDLHSLVRGAVITRVELRRKDMLVQSTAAQVRRALQGATLCELDRRGKALILRFSSGYTLFVHFRMTGQLYPIDPAVALPAYTCSVLHLHDGRRLVHVDARRLGKLELVATARESQSVTLANLGPDVWTAPPTARHLAGLLARRHSAIKLFLLDQKHLSGIGNIYASEILARARIDPRTPCDQLTAADVRKLLSQTRAVLGEALALRGTTVTNYRTGTGATGGFQAALRVYGREGERCLRRGCRGRIARIVQGQRSTFYCPCCQPPPEPRGPRANRSR